MIYNIEVHAVECNPVWKVMKIRANNEEEAKELCQNLLDSGLDKGHWNNTDSDHWFGIYGVGIKNKTISKVLGSEEEK